MELLEALQARHSVRSYLVKEIEPEKVAQLEQAIADYNNESGLSIQLCLNSPAAFDSMLARYGSFKNTCNYLALIGPKTAIAEEGCGYYGQKLVLLAQQLGLNTCWVGGSYSKRKSVAAVGAGEKLYLVVALGYGETQGKPRKTKPIEELCSIESDSFNDSSVSAFDDSFDNNTDDRIDTPLVSPFDSSLPSWFTAAMRAAQLAPTAMNQQKYHFTLAGNMVKAKRLSGFYSLTDLGIVKCNFEIGAEAAGATLGTDWDWAD